MALNDVIEARVVTLAGQQVGLNVFHYRIQAPVAPEPTRADIAARLDVVFAPRYIALLSSAATYRGVGARRVFPGPRTNEDTGVANTGLGVGGADLLPKQVCSLISLRTAEATRRGRGRKYIAFGSETDNTAAGAPTAGYLANLVLLATQFVAVVTVTAGGGSLQLEPVIFRRSDNTVRVVTNSIARASWATQRRRGDLGRTNLSPF